MNSFETEVLRIIADNDVHSFLFWRVENNGQIKFYIVCNDLFAWALADLQELTPENLPELKQALQDIHTLAPDHDIEGMDLFCARQRKMRPQGAAYPKNKDLWPLFDACGPERDINTANPKRPGD